MGTGNITDVLEKIKISLPVVEHLIVRSTHFRILPDSSARSDFMCFMYIILVTVAMKWQTKKTLPLVSKRELGKITTRKVSKLLHGNEDPDVAYSNYGVLLFFST